MVLQPDGRSGSSRRFWSVQMLSEEQVRNSGSQFGVLETSAGQKNNCLSHLSIATVSFISTAQMLHLRQPRLNSGCLLVEQFHIGCCDWDTGLS